jgi:biotin synthase
MPKKIFLCAICNVSSGNCSEDCKFCTQSSKHNANIKKYKNKPIEQIVQEAKLANKNGATGFCLVTAGRKLQDKEVPFIAKTAATLKQEIPKLQNIIACNGTATREQLKELKNAGITTYNHNLETSKEFYSQICTTHTWEERWETCLAIKEVGLKLICGGIFGLGESQEDRKSFITSLKQIQPFTIPINFFMHDPSLPLKAHHFSVEEALEIIKKVRTSIPEAKKIMIAGGRERTFKDKQYKIFDAGANAIVLGNYLTTTGEDAQKDKDMITSLGLEIATSCHG